jgi:hypothetical protein
MMPNAEYYIAAQQTDPMVLDTPGTIRWASGHPEGSRSLTWQVTGARNSDNVYVAARGMMHDMKLSLHQSGVWRWAFTQPATAKHRPAGADSLVIRYAETVQFTPGWRHGAVIRTPSATFGPAFDEPRPSDRQPIRFFPAPAEPVQLQYHVLLGEPDAPTTTIDNAIFDVGRMTLKSGKRVWVIATEWQMNDATQQSIDAVHQLVADKPEAKAGIASGEIDGVPLLLDLCGAQSPSAGETQPG